MEWFLLDIGVNSTSRSGDTGISAGLRAIPSSHGWDHITQVCMLNESAGVLSSTLTWPLQAKYHSSWAHTQISSPIDPIAMMKGKPPNSSKTLLELSYGIPTAV